jgi:hypothetical protein
MKSISLKYRLIVVLITLFSFTAASYAQNPIALTEKTKILNKNKQELNKERIDSNNMRRPSKIQRRVKKLNHKKSNEIISIKAYRKSLNIKVKTVKIC